MSFLEWKLSLLSFQTNNEEDMTELGFSSLRKPNDFFYSEKMLLLFTFLGPIIWPEELVRKMILELGLKRSQIDFCLIMKQILVVFITIVGSLSHMWYPLNVSPLEHCLVDKTIYYHSKYWWFNFLPARKVREKERDFSVLSKNLVVDNK